MLNIKRIDRFKMSVRIRLPGETLKDAKEREKREDELREKRIHLRKKEINQIILKGDEFAQNKRLKTAFYRYLKARRIASNYNGVLLPLCDEKLKMVQDLVHQDLYINLEKTLEYMEAFFLEEQYKKLKPIAREFRNYIKRFEWAQIKELLKDFQSVLLEL